MLRSLSWGPGMLLRFLLRVQVTRLLDLPHCCMSPRLPFTLTWFSQLNQVYIYHTQRGKILALNAFKRLNASTPPAPVLSDARRLLYLKGPSSPSAAALSVQLPCSHRYSPLCQYLSPRILSTVSLCFSHLLNKLLDNIWLGAGSWESLQRGSSLSSIFIAAIFETDVFTGVSYDLELKVEPCHIGTALGVGTCP